MEQVDRDQVHRAVVALKQYLAKKQAQNAKQTLVEDTNVISLIVTRNTIPPKASLKAIPIALPHSIRADGDVCLFVKDADKKRIKEALQKDPVLGLTKVMGVKKLKKHFGQFKDRRELMASYGTFLADDRILPYLKSLLGKKFYDAKKQPVTVQVATKTFSDHIRRILAGTTMFVSTGPCINVKVAHDQLDTEQIVDNIVQGAENVISYVPKKWKNIKSISIKTNDSIALPIYNELPNSSKLPITKKRSIEETSQKENITPAAKKTKKDDSKVEDKKQAKPVKKDDAKSTPEEKKSTPVKKEEKKSTPVKKDATKKVEKKETPVKDEKKATPTKKEEKKVTPVKKATNVKVAAKKTEAVQKTVAAKNAPKTAKEPAKKPSAVKKAAPAKKAPTKKTGKK